MFNSNKFNDSGAIPETSDLAKLTKLKLVAKKNKSLLQKKNSKEFNQDLGSSQKSLEQQWNVYQVEDERSRSLDMLLAQAKTDTERERI